MYQTAVYRLVNCGITQHSKYKKKTYYAEVHRLNVNVLLSSITFSAVLYIICCFRPTSDYRSLAKPLSYAAKTIPQNCDSALWARLSPPLLYAG